ncbi:MAG: chemotaxis protein CheX [Pirellula sp.]|jgi:chemotaxis protein CheX|nr:chemotaxis protein CheX [Pirellula sp.]
MHSILQDLTIEPSAEQERILVPFIQCTKDVFSMMLGWPVETVAVISDRQGAQRHDCSGILGFSGALRGSIVVSLDQEVALAATEAFLGERQDSLTAEVIDTVGELTNMIGGSSKDRLGVSGVAIGLPTIISGRNHCVSFDPRAQVEMIRFQTPHGPFTIEIAIVGLDAIPQ